MDMATRIPDMADDALATLHANAVRLADGGTAKQKKAASDLLPAILTELSTRQARKAAKATTSRKRTKAKAAAAE